MCKAPKPVTPPPAPKPEYLHNPFTDAVRNEVAQANAMRSGRGSLVIPLNRGGASAASSAPAPSMTIPTGTTRTTATPTNVLRLPRTLRPIQ